MKKNPKKTSQTTDLLINYVIDASGSMGHLVKATTEGFNSFIQTEEQMGVGETYVTETLFDTTITPVYVGKHSSQVAELGTDENPYRPGGGTALYDAVGTSIQGVTRWLAVNDWFKGKVLTVIYTDGAENSSREYNLHQINNMISQKTEEGWVFQFMGTGEEGWRSAQAFAAIPVRNRAKVAASHDGLIGSYSASNMATTAFRGGGGWNYVEAGK